MFSAQLNTVENKILSITKTLQFKSAIIEFLPKENEWESKKVALLKQSLPDIQEWKIYDHSACFNSLYNLYETFVHKLIASVLMDYQSHTPYSELPEILRDRHSIGTGEILQKISQNKYNHINKADLHKELYLCSLEGQQYSITPETICAHDNNIRTDVLSDLFNRVGYHQIANYLENCNRIRAVVEYSEHATCQKLLKEFVDRRNDCSHGEVDEILSTNQLLFFCNFVRTLCFSIGDFAKSNLLNVHAEKEIITKRGTVVECYKNNASVLNVCSGQYSVGDKIFVNYNGIFKSASIQSIQINDENTDNCLISSETEIGLKTDLKLKAGMALFL
ncbi:MAE_28990/MAE_18760 family HEPN-like nuclease [Aliiglaciecola lipolytica]|uniref:MAE_28990/MAE_18760 family HEPN-like nuclease n=1 Tax=Aliiglaciecola lipolytica TaxID=477689 RepID=UPI001C0858D0|nr:MAE_28990/MAE_18760 family HEPN-like nuclease [Aliiglaciecola lipolytica]MBU2877719.1 hypothetical protein [Aliiglaciecola lipolytica]